MRRPRIFANLCVGKPHISPSSTSHTPGVRQGNEPGSVDREPGFQPVGERMAVGTARRSTGVNPKGHNPIDPRMPNLSPP